ncbi:MAG: CPBP family intramembrane metalloprotease [Synechococcales cyanobacterium K44_A2020_017]|nr:CPBP family intramembrane metalloprotease [Synechococcales cyanobacterium K32_A2020_035]MBF2096104.1 CPBP family intramembrane metalloprotease [Synechococcales cyanobacterium K44_A2020_017]
MPLRPLILGILTVLVVLRVSTLLLASWNEPQITSRLQLYQTDLLLNAAELDIVSSSSEAGDVPPVQNVLVGANPLATALKQYQEVRESAETSLQGFQKRLDDLNTNAAGASPPAIATPSRPAAAESTQTLQRAIQQQQSLLNQLDVRIGLLQVNQDETQSALELWQQVMERSPPPSSESTTAATDPPLGLTAEILSGLWSQPARILPEAEANVQKNLDGWFRYQSLARLYTLQQRTEALTELQTLQQAIAQSTLGKLAVIGLMPVVGSLIGIVLLIVIVVQRVLKGSESLLAQNGSLAWETPWNWEIIWQVLIVGFFLVGQLAIPLLLGLVGFNFSAFGIRAKAAYTLTYYLSMSSLGLLVLYLSIRSYFPLPKNWFRVSLGDRWLAWGVGGYFVALPLMIVVSLLNQQIWQGQGGSNPLLQIVLEEGDPISLSIFFFTASIAAPVFEELLFRGFLLSSLTRYFPVWGAILVSGLVFAIAHLSLSEVLPLTLLGCILGVVYTRSRNMLAPMVLHSLWNGATMLSLFVLGSN